MYLFLFLLIIIYIRYLQSLYDAYEIFIAEIARTIPVIKVDYSNFRTPEEMAASIVREYEQIANIRNVVWDK
jgi:deoxyadenosine kinase